MSNGGAVFLSAAPPSVALNCLQPFKGGGRGSANGLVMAAMGLPRLGVFPAWWDSGCKSETWPLRTKSKLHSTVRMIGTFLSWVGPLLLRTVSIACTTFTKLFIHFFEPGEKTSKATFLECDKP